MSEQGEQPDPNFMTDERRELIRGVADDVIALYPAWRKVIDEADDDGEASLETDSFLTACSELVSLVHTPASLAALDERQLEAYKGAFAIEIFSTGTRPADSVAVYPAFDELKEQLEQQLVERGLPALPETVTDTTALHQTWLSNATYLLSLFAALREGVDFGQLNKDLGHEIGIPHFEAAKEINKDV
jgi:hypothetical protein